MQSAFLFPPSPSLLFIPAALALVTFALLWPEERGSAAGRVRALLFAALAGAVGFALVGRQMARSGNPATGRAFQAYVEGLVDAKAAEATDWAARAGGILGGAPHPPDRHTAPRRPLAFSSDQPAELRQRALRAYAQAVRLAPDVTLFRRQDAILLADAGRLQEARFQFRELARVDGDLWERLYGPRPPRTAELPGLKARVRALQLGWFELLVWRSVYRRIGRTEQAAALSDAAGRQAALLVGALSVAVLVMLGVAVVGLALLGAVLVNWRAGRLRPVPPVFRAGAAPLLEAFVLYMFLSVSPVLLGVDRRLLGLPASERSAFTLALWLGSDLLALVAVAYLWARLRAHGLSLAEIGLHTRELGRNVLYGVGGYVAAWPLVIGSGLLAGWLGRRFFPQVAPPFHPIEAMAAAAPSGWVRFALLVIAAVGAPILEEIFFRGLLYGALRRRFGIAAGVLLSAVVFSLLHPQLPLGFLPIFVLGAVFALLYEWRQSLIPGMVMHALNNGLIWIYLNLLFPPG